FQIHQLGGSKALDESCRELAEDGELAPEDLDVGVGEPRCTAGVLGLVVVGLLGGAALLLLVGDHSLLVFRLWRVTCV
ncbi:MAG: hypothetical protein ACK559_23685, partial [bacterium]